MFSNFVAVQRGTSQCASERASQKIKYLFHKCTPAYRSELRRTTFEAEDCNHEVTRNVTAAINVGFQG